MTQHNDVWKLDEEELRQIAENDQACSALESGLSEIDDALEYQQERLNWGEAADKAQLEIEILHKTRAYAARILKGLKEAQEVSDFVCRLPEEIARMNESGELKEIDADGGPRETTLWDLVLGTAKRDEHGKLDRVDQVGEIICEATCDCSGPARESDIRVDVAAGKLDQADVGRAIDKFGFLELEDMETGERFLAMPDWKPTDDDQDDLED